MLTRHMRFFREKLVVERGTKIRAVFLANLEITLKLIQSEEGKGVYNVGY